MQERQDLILYLASMHAAAVRSNRPYGFCQIPIRLMALRDWVYDYRPALDHFFDVVQTGYHLPNDFELSIITPRRLGVDARGRNLVYVPPPLPRVGIVSKVQIQVQHREQILAGLASTGRLDLHAPVVWLLEHPEVNFWFSPAGKLQLRDTSTWPVAAIETWPAWLREDLFGPGIDIEAAYTQFLVERLRTEYADREDLLRLLYPDLLRSLEDKAAWRRQVCATLGLAWDERGEGVVKQLCMSLANGSRISPAILRSGMEHSAARDIVLRETPSGTDLDAVGGRLERLGSQYSSARRQVCAGEATRTNQKRVFLSYFEWEREARYRIWEAVGRHGIMVHDGIDGVPEEYLRDLPGLVRSLDLRLSRS